MEEKGGKEIWKELACCLYFSVQKESCLLSEVLSLRGGIISLSVGYPAMVPFLRQDLSMPCAVLCCG